MKKKFSGTPTVKRILLLSIPPLLLWMFILVLLYTSRAIEVVGQNSSFSFVTYSDDHFKGNSFAKANKTGHTIHFNYELKEGYQFPYAGLCLFPAGKEGFRQLQALSNIDLRITSNRSQLIPILLNEYIPGYSDTVSNKNYRVWSCQLRLQPGKDHYTLPLSAFEVPSWWHKEHEQQAKLLPPFSPGRIRNICIQNCTLLPVNTRDEIKISALSIEKDYSQWVIPAAAFSALWFLGVLFFWVIKRKKTTMLIPYVATEAPAETRNEWEMVRSYVASHYMEELDLDTMQKALGIAKHKISSLIRENTSLIFRQYLNAIRVAEAKRLLLETELPVGEIADKAGFGHISNFNRVYKEHTGLSPSDTRKKINC